MTMLPDLKSVLRVETLSRKAHKLPNGFYESVRRGIIEHEKDLLALSGDEIRVYVDGKIILESYRSDLLSFMQRRLEKLSILAIYGIGDSGTVTEEERELVSELNLVLRKFMDHAEGKL